MVRLLFRKQGKWGEIYFTHQASNVTQQRFQNKCLQIRLQMRPMYVWDMRQNLIISTTKIHQSNARRKGNWSHTCYHNCTTFTKPIQLSKKEFVSAFYVLTLSTNEKSSHRAAAGRKWKNKFRKSVRAVVFYPSCVSIYNLSMVYPPFEALVGSRLC